jgi:hypothetical protein
MPPERMFPRSFCCCALSVRRLAVTRLSASHDIAEAFSVRISMAPINESLKKIRVLPKSNKNVFYRCGNS